MGDFWNGLAGIIKVLIIATACVIMACALGTCSLLGQAMC